MASGSVVGFVGLDDISLELATSLLHSGYSVQAFEAGSPLVDKFLKLGGKVCANATEATKGVAALVILLSHADQINDLILGDEGVLNGLSKDTVTIFHSNVLPSQIQKLELTLRDCYGTNFVVDIYVSKAVSEVLNDKTMIISSGSLESIARAQPILSAMCSKLYNFEGEVGAGSKAKMVIELLEGIHSVASVEAICLGAQAGIHPWILYDIISNAAGNSWVFKNSLPQLLRGNQTKHLFLNLFIQNLGNVLDMAKSHKFAVPLLTVAHQQLIAGSSHPQQQTDDDSTLLKVWESLLGVNLADAVNSKSYNPEELASQITSQSDTVKRIGFIGLGAMGFGMATHLLKSNFCVNGYDVYPPSLSRFADAGGLTGSTPAEVSQSKINIHFILKCSSYIKKLMTIFSSCVIHISCLLRKELGLQFFFFLNHIEERLYELLSG